MLVSMSSGPSDLDRFVASFRDGSLPRAAWTHEAHLVVCWGVLHACEDVDAAVDELSRLITAYNACTGLPADRVPCHETITRYYVLAVTAADPPTMARLLTHPWCTRRAPARHWSSPLLWSHAARTGWVDPDLEALPWTSTPSTGLDRRHRPTILH